MSPASMGWVRLRFLPDFKKNVNLYESPSYRSHLQNNRFWLVAQSRNEMMSSTRFRTNTNWRTGRNLAWPATRGTPTVRSQKLGKRLLRLSR